MHTPTYKSSRSVKKWKLPQKSEWQLPSGDGEVGVGKGLGRGKWGLLGAGKFPACYLSQYRPHQFSFCDIEYLCCILSSLLVILHSNKSERNKTVLSLCHQTMEFTETFASYKIMGKGWRKKCVPRVGEKLPGNSTAAKDIKSADKEFEMNSD